MNAPGSTASFRQLLDLMPEVDALEVLRIALARHAVTHPDHLWSDGERSATVDVRVLDPAAIRQAVAEALAEEQRDTQEMYSVIAEVLSAEAEGDRTSAVRRLIRAGEEREARSRYAIALRFYRSAVDASGPLANHGPRILALRRVGRVQAVRGELAEAESAYHLSLQHAIHAGLVEDEVIARTGLGNILVRGGRWSDAESAYQQALARIAESGLAETLHKERGQLMNNMARVTAEQGRLETARQWLEEAGAVWRECESTVDHLVWRALEASILWHEGRIEEACELYEETIASDPPRIIRAAYEIDLANMMAEAGQFDEAWEWGRAAEASAFAASAVGYVVHVYRGLGNVARESGTEAVAFYEKALEIARRYRLRLDEAQTLIEYARLRERDSNVEEALAYLTSAIEICEAIGAEKNAEEARSELARIERPPQVVGATSA